MSDAFIRLLGGPPLEHNGRVVRYALDLGNSIGRGWLIALVVVLIVAAYFSYRRVADMISPVRRYLLLALRIGFFLLLVLFLARPICEMTMAGTTRRQLVLLVDTSKSMSIQDSRQDQADQKRATMALGGSAQATPNPSRIDLVKAELGQPALAKERVGLVTTLQRDFDLDAYSFADTVTSLASAEKPGTIELANLKPSGSSTAIGAAIRDVLRQKRGQPLAGILLMSDGGNNAGSAPADAAQLAADEGVPIFTYGVGVTRPHDIAVTDVFVERYAFSKNQLPVAVRIRSVGMIGKTVPLVVRLGDQTVVNKDVTFDRDGETVVDAHFTPETPGDYQLVASIAPQNDEVLKDNNSAKQSLRIIDGKIKVLYVESAPRWDFKYLQAMLLRDPRISPRFVLLEGDPGITGVEGSPYIQSIPTERDDLFHYDLIILGDIAPDALTKSQQEMLDEFVSKLGGAVIFLAGQNHNPGDFVNTPLEKLLPVVPAKSSDQGDFAKPVQLQLSEMAKSNAMLALSDDQAENEKRWASLPPVYWTAPVAKLKTGAQALLLDPDPARGAGPSGMPVMAIQSYGLGQVLFLGTDETWRWRKNELIPLHDALWSQIIQRLGLPHLLGLSQKVQITSDKERYTVGDAITVYARVYGDNFEPLASPSVDGSYSAHDGAPTSASLAPVPGQPGLFKGTFVATAAGEFAFGLNNISSTKLRFDVEETKLEMGDPAMNEILLKELSQSSGGQFFREEDLDTLPDAIRSKSAEVQTSMTLELGTSPLLYAMILAVVCTEWILRKSARLK